MSLKINEFLSDLEASPATERAYKLDLQQFNRFLNGREPTRELAMDFLRERRASGLSGTTVARKGYAIRAYWEWLYGVPLHLRLPPLVRVSPHAFTIDELKRLLDAVRTPMEKALLMVLYDSGARVGELLGTIRGRKGERLPVVPTIKSVDWDRGEIPVIRKGGRSDTIAVGRPTLDALREYISWARPHRNGGLFPYGYDEVRKWFLEVAEAAGVEGFRFHRLRHSRAVHDKLSGIPIPAISDHLGHTSQVTTDKIYGRIEAKERRERVGKPFWEK